MFALFCAPIVPEACWQSFLFVSSCVFVFATVVRSIFVCELLFSVSKVVWHCFPTVLPMFSRELFGFLVRRVFEKFSWFFVFVLSVLGFATPPFCSSWLFFKKDRSG